MSERQSVERVISRMYKHHLKTLGRLPTGAEKRKMEQRAGKVAERADNKRNRR